MSEINLLPWRELKRKKEKKWFMTLFWSAVVVGVVMICLINRYVNWIIDKQEQYNFLLREEIMILDEKIKKISLIKSQKKIMLNRINIMNDLEEDRLLIVYLFNELVKIVPDSIYLSLVQKKRHKIILQGFSKSNNAISLLMRNIEKKSRMKMTNLIEIKKIKLEKLNKFKLSFILK